MLLSSITWIFISLLLIVLVHYLYSFFKNTLTIPKMRDLVNKPIERYNEIYTTINHDNKTSPAVVDNASDMQNELKQFLQHLHTNDAQHQQQAPQIESHTMGGGNAFSSYT